MLAMLNIVYPNEHKIMNFSFLFLNKNVSAHIILNENRNINI